MRKKRRVRVKVEFGKKYDINGNLVSFEKYNDSIRVITFDYDSYRETGITQITDIRESNENRIKQIVDIEFNKLIKF